MNEGLYAERQAMYENLDVETMLNNRDYYPLIWAHNDFKIKLTSEQIDQIIRTTDSPEVHHGVTSGIGSGRTKLTPEQIDIIIHSPGSVDAHYMIVNTHAYVEGKLELTPSQIDAIIHNPNSEESHSELLTAHNREEIILTPEQIEKLNICPFRPKLLVV